MSGWLPFEADSYTGLRKDLYHDEADKKVHIRYTQDVEPLLERNKYLQNHGSKYERGKKEGMAHAASIPPVVQIEWLEKYGVNIYDRNATKKILELLNRPEYRYLKTTTKKI